MQQEDTGWTCGTHERANEFTQSTCRKMSRYYKWLPALSDLQVHSRTKVLGLRQKEGGDGVGSTGSENCPISFFCGYDNGNSGVIKAGNFVDS